MLGFNAVHIVEPKDFWFVKGSPQGTLHTLLTSDTVPPSGQVIKFTCSPRETAPDEVDKKFLSWFGLHTICIQAGKARAAYPNAAAAVTVVPPRPVGGIVWLTVAPETFAATIEACDPLFWSTAIPRQLDTLRVVHNGDVIEFAWDAPGPVFERIAKLTRQ